MTDLIQPLPASFLHFRAYLDWTTLDKQFSALEVNPLLCCFHPFYRWITHPRNLSKCNTENYLMQQILLSSTVLTSKYCDCFFYSRVQCQKKEIMEMNHTLLGLITHRSIIPETKRNVKLQAAVHTSQNTACSPNIARATPPADFSIDPTVIWGGKISGVDEHGCVPFLQMRQI